MNMLQREFMQETAGALRRTEDKVGPLLTARPWLNTEPFDQVNWALLQLEDQGREINKATCSLKRRELIARFNQLRKEAIQARQELAIHREVRVLCFSDPRQEGVADCYDPFVAGRGASDQQLGEHANHLPHSARL